MFILESVKGFTTINNGREMKQVIDALRHIKVDGSDRSGPAENQYFVIHRVMNTKDHGIPQSQPRWFCVGIAKTLVKDASLFAFPDNISCPPLDSFLEPADVSPTSEPELGRQALLNVQETLKKIREQFVDPMKHTCVINIDASAKRVS